MRKMEGGGEWGRELLSGGNGGDAWGDQGWGERDSSRVGGKAIDGKGLTGGKGVMEGREERG